MVNVLLTSESRYPVNRKAVKQAVAEVLAEQKIKSDIEVSILIIGDRKMTELNKKYLGREGTTDVLSFPLGNDSSHPELVYPDKRRVSGSRNKTSLISCGSEIKFGMTSNNKGMPNQARTETNKSARHDIGLGFVNPPDEILRLGDIIISYPQAVKQAGENNILVDQEIGNLVKHGVLHLLGIHHE